MRQWGKAASWILTAALLCSQVPSVAVQAETVTPGSNAAKVTTEADNSVSGNQAGITAETADGLESNPSADGIATVSTGNLDEMTYIANDENGIPDAKLYEIMLNTGDSNLDGLLSVAEAKAITYIYLYKSIQDYTGLSYASNLQSISFEWDSSEDSWSAASDSFLTEYGRLTQCSTVYNIEFLSDEMVSAFAQNTSVTNLDMTFSDAVTDFSPLAQLSGLSNLTLNRNYYDNVVMDLSFLTAEAFPHLETLSVYSMYIPEMPENIGGLTTLKALYWQNNNTRKLTDLTGLVNLENLSLSGNYLTAEEIKSKAPAKFAEDESWIENTVDPYYDPELDEYYAANSPVIRNDETGIPDSELYTYMLYFGDQQSGNSDGILTEFEARKLGSLVIPYAVKDYTGLSYAYNISSLSFGNYINSTSNEDNWEAGAESFFVEYGKLTKLSSMYNVKVLGDAMLAKLAENTSLTYLDMNMKESAIEDWSVLENSSVKSLRLYNCQEIPQNMSDTVKSLVKSLRISLQYVSGSPAASIDVSAFSNLDNLHVYGNISSLTGLDKLQSLNYLYAGNYGQEKGEIGALPASLSYLDLYNFNINSISDTNISQMNRLYSLHLRNAGLQDIAGLENLTQLQYLDISNNKVISLEPVAALTNLTNLYAENNDITDITGLENLTKLTYLQLGNNEITNLQPVAALTNLQYLYANSNHITDITGLENLTGLRRLDLSRNELTEIPDLSGMTGLTQESGSLNGILSLSGNKLTKEALAGRVPALFSDNVLWMAKATAQYINYSLCYGDLSAKELAAVIYEWDSTYHSVSLLADSKVELTADLLAALKADNMSLTLYFLEEDGINQVSYHMGGNYGFPNIEQTAVVKKDGLTDVSEADKAAVEGVLASYGISPVFYFQNDAISEQCYVSIQATMDRSGQHYVYYYDRAAGKISLVGESYSYSGSMDASGQPAYYVIMYNGGLYWNAEEQTSSFKFKDGWTHPASEGIYFVVDRKCSFPDSTEGVYSDAPMFDGECLNSMTEFEADLTEKIAQAAEGDTIEISYMGYMAFSGKIWNEAIAKKLKIKASIADYSGSTLLVCMEVDTAQMNAFSEQMEAHRPSMPFIPYKTVGSGLLAEAIGDCTILGLETNPYVKNADAAIYVGDTFKNGEKLNAYSYTAYYPSSSGNNTLGSSPYIVSIKKLDWGDMVVDTGMVEVKGATASTTVILVNGELDLSKVPMQPETPSEPDTPDNPDTPSEPDTPQDPDAPSEPDTPSDTNTPSEPDTPSDTNTPSKPDTSENPDAPKDPVTPSEEENSAPEVIAPENIVSGEEAADKLKDIMENAFGRKAEIAADAAPVLPKEIFDDMRRENKNISVSVVNEKNEKQYEWSFNSNELDPAKFVDLDLTVKFETEKQQEIQNITGQTSAFYMSFNHHGELPAPATMTVYVGNQYKNGEKVYLYYYNEESNTVEAVDGGGLSVQNGYVTYTITHCSIYFLSTEAPAGTENEDDGSDSDYAAAEVNVDWNQVSVDLSSQTAVKNSPNWNVIAGSNVVVPGSTLQALKNGKLTLALHTSVGATFSLSSEHVTRSVLSKGLNLSVRSNQFNVPSALVDEKLRGTVASRNISMTSHDAFGMLVNLHVGLGAKNAGKYANLYCYNDAAGCLEYMGSFCITKEGQAMFGLTKGAEYLVTVTDVKPNEKAAAGSVHYVQKGDTLSRIAAKYSVSVYRLLELNPEIRDMNLIFTGQNIRVR